ncbi:hypothetical protein SUGI_0543300 [Cryptomeria japonica]|nr:hypothetical protein SUGI_0543300 [Cryptomeria japonica]
MAIYQFWLYQLIEEPGFGSIILQFVEVRVANKNVKSSFPLKWKGNLLQRRCQFISYMDQAILCYVQNRAALMILGICRNTRHEQQDRRFVSVDRVAWFWIPNSSIRG